VPAWDAKPRFGCSHSVPCVSHMFVLFWPFGRETNFRYTTTPACDAKARCWFFLFCSPHVLIFRFARKPILGTQRYQLARNPMLLLFAFQLCLLPACFYFGFGRGTNCRYTTMPACHAKPRFGFSPWVSHMFRFFVLPGHHLRYTTMPACDAKPRLCFVFLSVHFPHV